MNNIEELLINNTYPGRGIVTGKSNNGKYAVIAYFIMGRSRNSRNRYLEKFGDDIYTRPIDMSIVKNPELIIYRALTSQKNRIILTNGDQTDTILESLKENGTFESALSKRENENDAPNYTPRISSLLTFSDNDFSYEMSILKKNKESDNCIRKFFSFDPIPSKGHFIHTYESDGDPLPSFEGEPREIMIDDDMDTFSQKIWYSLNEDNKISLFVRYYDLKDRSYSDKIFNKYI